MNEPRPELEQALERLKRNRYDEAAWVRLYDQLVPRARAASYRILGGNPTHVADVVQDALERLLRYSDFQRFASADDLLRYFAMMARNSALDLLRRSPPTTQGPAATAGGDPDQEPPDEDVPDDAAGPDEILSAARELTRLDGLLSTKEKLVFSLLAQGYGRSEIASRLGITESHTSVLVHRLRLRMRELTHRI